MKALFIYLFLISLSYSATFNLDNNKELELEAKILANIAKSSMKEDVFLYIPNISKLEEEIYSKYLNLSKTCEEANFVFLKNDSVADKCNSSNKLFFTNNYQRLLKQKRYYGAFFWNKSRPNIVFVKKRLKKEGIDLPKNYIQFIEDL